MKKNFLIALLVSLMGGAIFAEDFVVTKIVGNVNYEVSSGVWKTISIGDTITDQTVVDVGINSLLSLADTEGTDFTVRAMKKGRLETLLAKGTGLKKASTAAASSVRSGGLSSAVSTASSRASEAKEDLNWDE